MASSPKFDSLLEEFSGELAHTGLIPPRINEAFYDDHVKEISSGSIATHYDSSLYDSFIFDLSINPFPPANKSDFYEFVEELTHIISPPKYDCDCFKIEPNLVDFTIDLVEDISPTKELRVHNALPTHPTFQLNLAFILSSESLFTYSSVENLVPIPSTSEDFSDIKSECDMLDCDDSQTTNFSTFANPLFDDSTSNDDESSHEEVIHEMSFKFYSNPLFDLNEEIISCEFNPIHNEDLDCTPKNDRFDTKSYLLESLLTRDTLMASSPKFDSLLEKFSGELAHTGLIPPRINEAFYDDHEMKIPFLISASTVIISLLSCQIIPGNVKTHAKGFCLQVFISSASIRESLRCQKPGHLATRLGCAERKVATWDDLAFKLITLGWNLKYEKF
nr:hypothetical protein [Tanacetum cinerariifolium]